MGVLRVDLVLGARIGFPPQLSGSPSGEHGEGVVALGRRLALLVVHDRHHCPAPILSAPFMML